MNDAIVGQKLDQVVDGREDGAVEEVGVVLVILLLALESLALGGELFRRHVLERLNAPEPPIGK
jgi:hypothetical protein